MSQPIRIAMWSGPRNISTAMMRAFENRPDTSVIDEPFYAAYLALTGHDHPMRDAVIASQSGDPAQVVAALVGPIPGGRTIFYQKHMTHHMLPAIDRSWMDSCQHAFLIRSPDQVVASYVATRSEVTLEEIGFTQQSELFDQVAQRRGMAPPVLDAGDVRADPRRTLTALCVALGVDFDEAMLHWPAGRRASDGVWAPAWYGAVERSTGFDGRESAPVALNPTLQAIADTARPHYELLAGFRL
jgi:hypothetical protein